MMTTTMDMRDVDLVAGRMVALDAIDGPRVGDWVRFADGVERRISYVWEDEDGTPFSVQTSSGGSFYLGNGHVSYSGGLFPGVPPETLSLTGEVKPGDVWIFHHDLHRAHNGVDTVCVFRVFDCSEVAS